MNYDELLTVITLEDDIIANIYINMPDTAELFNDGTQENIAFNQFDHIDIESNTCREWIEYVLDTMKKNHWDDCRVYSIMDAGVDDNIVYH